MTRAAGDATGPGPGRAGKRRGAWARAVPAWAALLALAGALGAGGEPMDAHRTPNGFDLALYARLLDAHTVESGDTAGVRVDYRGLRDSPEWSALVAGIASAPPPGSDAGRSERLAFWINVYNVLAIQTVVDHYPVESIRDVGSLFRPVWNREAGRVGGDAVTLGGIEHRILRPLGEPRIHAAIVCASTSCPSLAREPYRSDRLDAQLDAAARRWLASPTKGLRVDRSAGRITLSRIFDWFEEDFDAVGGVLAFVRRHAPESERAWLEARGDRLSIDYFDYDWTLNDAAALDRRARGAVPRVATADPRE